MLHHEFSIPIPGIMEAIGGAPTPRAGPDKPGGACPGGGSAIPLLATRPKPGPGILKPGCFGFSCNCRVKKHKV